MLGTAACDKSLPVTCDANWLGSLSMMG